MTPITTGALSISDGRLALATLLILVNVALSAFLRLGLGRTLLIASTRMVVQLLLVGSVLEWLFHQDNAPAILLLALVMALIAGISAVQRTRRRFAGIYRNSLVSVMGSSALVTGLAIVAIIQPEPWFTPQYLIPLLGMVLGNTLNGISLGLDRLMEGLLSRREQVEAWLALGGTRWEACNAVVRDAIRIAMIPTINSMMVMGLVSLPGMMTGQILEGAAPAAAVRYQIVILFMISAATALGVFGVVLLGYRSLTNQDHQLRLDRLSSLRPRT
ncbi:ABC transporter permease [Synechococcus sp. CBW1107]|uniref:ABC transporter permease n=1 Tax=Synechococcus sp. CBW1107 TaxID=2789857 RepID=UPI002AD3770D|nr:iron export ABC transporter permease subunit FetB [Synechococcus sp. CBW1107]CAK6687577.1 putative iron export permease protein FetB [Synechococcus sp. CBW1107]